MNKSAVTFALSALILGSASFAAKKQNDPVVMTVGPEKVTLSEFEYLYQKNREQQTQTTSLDDYIDMFVNYKLKVAAARDAKVDTSATYISEIKKYTDELARPYLRTQSVDDSLVNVAYNHMTEMVNVSHILLPPPSNPGEEFKARALADSIHQVLLNGGDFAELAKKYSMDKATADNGGHMGYIAGGMWPYTFEDLVFNTPAGKVSDVAESRFGYHIVLPTDRRPNPGTVKARHILKMTRGLSPEQEAKQKEAIDSIYNVVTSGADFAEVARNTTDEPQGKQSGGDLPWFGQGQMVAEFNDAAFALQPGQISKPVKTSFGWHIILCEGRKPVAPIDSLRPQIENKIKNDERARLAVQRTIDTWGAANNATLTENGKSEALAAFKNAGGLNEKALETLALSKNVAATIGKRTVTVGDVASKMRPNPDASPLQAAEAFNRTAHTLLNNATLDDYIATLPATHPAYRNLLNEYRDGMLLFEISNSQVWDRANSDNDGLQKYYEEHRAEFSWDRPHYKGYVIAATSDSIADAALAHLNEAMKTNPDATDAKTIRKKFGNHVKVERVLAAKGDNAVIDHLVFNGPKPNLKNRWSAYRTLSGKVIDQPEDARDVKGQVSLGYQQQLENNWLSELHKRYKVKVDRKAIKKAIGSN